MRCAACFLLLAIVVPAQLNLSLQTSFTHPLFGFNGNIGVVMDSSDQTVWALDFSNNVNLHHFDLAGNLLGSHLTTACSPSLVSPNGITQDRSTLDLWLVDNTGTESVLQMSPQASCLGGWSFTPPSPNPVCIAHSMWTGTLFIGSDSQISEWSLQGQQLPGGFPVTFPGGSNVVSGLAWVPYNGHFLHSQTGGSMIWESSPTGTPVSSLDLTPYGITNIQGLDYDPLSGLVVVTDNSTTTFFVFVDLNFNPGVYTLSLSQPAGPGSLQIDNSGLLPGNEVFNVFSFEPCLSGVGGGPYLGLCASNVQVLIDQLALPLGTIPFHFIASGTTATTGILSVSVAGVVVEAVSFDIQPNGVPSSISPVVQLVVL